MKFTPQNLKMEVPKIKDLAPELKNRWHNVFEKNIDLYDKSDTIKRGVDLFVMQLNQRYGDKEIAIQEIQELFKGKATDFKPENHNLKNENKSTQKSEKKQVKRAEKSKKQHAKQPKPAKPEFSGKYVEKILPEVNFIKRYAALHSKKFTSETKAAALRLLDSLQKAIVEKQIRKTSEYAKEINDIQSSLLKITNARADGSVIDIASIEHLREIAKEYRVSDSVKLIKQFIAIQGKKGVKDKAKALRDKIMQQTSGGTYWRNNIAPNLTDIVKSLEEYIDGNAPTPEISAQQLSGLYGLAGIDTPEPKSGTGISAAQFVASSFDTLPFSGKWGQFIGKPAKNFKLMIYGKAGSGKSTCALKLADYLAKDLGKRVLYVAGEEKFGYTLHEKIVRLNISSPNLMLNDKLPADLSGYDVVFIDSINTLGLEPEQLEKLPKGKAYVWIFQCTKEGNYRGSQAFEHNADSVIEVENMTARTIKNRFGGNNQPMKV